MRESELDYYVYFSTAEGNSFLTAQFSLFTDAIYYMADQTELYGDAFIFTLVDNEK